MYHHSLPGKSLTFRWYYWIGAGRLVAQQPLIAVGWDNFGEHYLAVRLPEAPEEVKDPHNFIVRAFAELGVPGGVLMVVWMGCLWWRMTRPLVDEEPAPRRGRRSK